jgi:hypothetical protein
MKECHDVGYLTANMLEEAAQRAVEIKCTTILVIVWEF